MTKYINCYLERSVFFLEVMQGNPQRRVIKKRKKSCCQSSSTTTVCWNLSWEFRLNRTTENVSVDRTHLRALGQVWFFITLCLCVNMPTTFTIDPSVLMLAEYTHQQWFYVTDKREIIFYHIWGVKQQGVSSSQALSQRISGLHF